MASTDLLTIVSTDWVESTATRTRLGEERADALQVRHDAILKETIEQHEGTVVKNSGDGVLATFRSTTHALSAAVAIQQRFDGSARSRPIEEAIALRVGVSAGEVVHRDDDIFGTPVVEAVRLQSAAGAGEILCSELVRLLGRGRGGFDFDLVGLLELKGLPEPVAACRVGWAPAEPTETLPMPPELAAGTATRFVGRDDELRIATESALAAEQTQAVWVLGEPGIGKTRLAAEVATRAHNAGALVLYGRCDEQVRAPFQPVIDGLRWFVSQQHDDELRARLGVDPDPLVRLVPELHARVPGLAVPGAVTEIEQYRLFESVRSWLGVIAQERPVVFVVDDVHWADRPTLALLGHVVRTAQPARLTMVATARDTDPDVSEHLNALVDELDRMGRSRRIELCGLTTTEIGAYLERSALPVTAAERLADETAGNPLFLGAVLAAVAVDGSLPTQLPTDVRAAVRRRVRRLEPKAQELLQVAALVGLDFSLDVAADAAHLDDGEGLNRVEQAVSAGLVEEMGIDRFRFTHALVREALATELSASRRARLHEAIGNVIETRYGARIDEHLRALAQHYANAGSPVLLERALDYARRAGQRAINLLAFDAAADDYEFALSIVERMPTLPDRSRLELYLVRGEAQQLDGNHQAALASFRAALELARREGDWAMLARAAIAFEETAWRPGSFGPEALGLLREAATHPLADVQRVWLGASLGRALHYCGDFAEARRVVEEALTEARGLDDVQLLAHALAASVQTLARFEPGEAELVLERAEEASHLDYVPASHEHLMSAAAQYAAVAALSLGDRRAFDRWFAEYVRVSEIEGIRFARYVALCDEQMRSFLDGDLAVAEEQANAALEFGQERDDVTGVHGVQMFMIRREQGRLMELAPVVRMILELNPAEAMWRPGLLLLLVELGMHDDARAVLAELAENGFAVIPRDILFAGSLCLLAESASLLGDVETARAIEVELAPWANSGAHLGHIVGYLGAVNRFLALLAWLLGRLDEADERFASAVDFNRRLDAVPWLARSLADWAALRHARGDHAGARSLADEARALAERHGLVAVRNRLHEVLAE